MRVEDLRELHYITAVENVPSILTRGILSHSRAERVVHVSVAMEVIQERRRTVVVPGGRPLHDYANTYINARNKMMYKVKSDISHDRICVLRIKPSVIARPGAVVADRNASSDYVRFDPAPEGFSRLDEATIFAESWNHPDPIEKQRHGSLMCAEVLVPDSIPPSLIIGAYVSTATAEAELRAKAPDLVVVISPHLFFR